MDSRPSHNPQFKVDRAMQTDKVMISAVKKNTFVVSKDKNVLKYKTYHNK